MKTVLKLILIAFLLLFRGVEDGNGFKRILRRRTHSKLIKQPFSGSDDKGRKRRKIQG
jgi:hypothetical protein